jgi:Family of unknown function (DUF6272)
LQKEVIIHFKGQLQFDNIGELIHLLKDKMRVRKISYAVYKKILMLMIELLENIIRYRENYDKKSNIIQNFPPEFSIQADQNIYYIESSNPILKSDMVKLEKRLFELNSMDKDKIRDLYKATITNGKFSEKGGAGLGIIEMAKMSDEKLIYHFTEIDKDYFYYSLKLAVKDLENIS